MFLSCFWTNCSFSKFSAAGNWNGNFFFRWFFFRIKRIILRLKTVSGFREPAPTPSAATSSSMKPDNGTKFHIGKFFLFEALIGNPFLQKNTERRVVLRFVWQLTQSRKIVSNRSGKLSIDPPLKPLWLVHFSAEIIFSLSTNTLTYQRGWYEPSSPARLKNSMTQVWILVCTKMEK